MTPNVSPYCLSAWRFNAAELDAVFAMTVAQNMAPYGPNPAVLLPDLLQQATLKCAGYSLLTGYLLDILAQGAAHDPLRMLGFSHPLFGNHVQLLYEEGSRSLLLDPTVGFVAIVPLYDAFFAGQTISQDRIATFYRYAPAKLAFVEEVYNSIYFGIYRPSYLMYFAPYPQFLADQWVSSPTAAELLMNEFLTPGGYRKAVQLGFAG